MQTTTNGTHTRGTTIKVKAPKVTEQPKEAVIYEIEKQVIAVTIVGIPDVPLICNKFSEKSIVEMEDNRRLSADEKREAKRTPRPPVVPEERFQAARTLDAKGRDCVEARHVKAMLVTACKYPDVTIPGTQLRGAVYVLGDLLPIKHDAKVPSMRRDIVRVGKFPNKQPDIRYRPQYLNWSLDLKIEFEPKLITLAALHHLIRRAGTSVGLCEWRPEKSPAGIYGRFDIKGLA